MMKPFSPLYFIKQNRERCFMLLFMIFLTYVSYLGGIYVTNVSSYFDYEIDNLRRFIVVKYNPSDENLEDYYKLKEVLSADENLTVIPEGVSEFIYTKTVMGFKSGFMQYVFNSVEDFKTFCTHMNIGCDFDNLKVGSMIMSSLSANNKGLNLGDKLEKGQEGSQEGIHDDYTLDALTDESGYHVYYINEQPCESDYLVLNLGMSEEAFLKYSNELMREYDVTIYNSQTYKEEIDAQLKQLNYIYGLILILLALILAVIINAVLAGMYQRREFEFAVYRALGYSKGQIIKKIAGELICMDIIGLVAGGGIFFLGLYLLNNLYLDKVGKTLFYFHPLALFGLIFCNVVLVVPSIFTRCRQMLKADICEY